ncbi:DNA starvation/stationary phase protection protein Dps [uncultured Alsobacter sp.]|uniref:DNA starvation/stationary phase protection protein Dps n=1 Tax=uncultured Alsobacter sp. TaxID=1748258 RepID=UPI0025E22571|nr:DNA starvation/stationary phase protection protein Dps [uncultured Alsobacter sp.]
MHTTRNTLPLAIREASVAVLNRHLAAAIDLHAQIKQAHWNVVGPGFIAVHELFDAIAGLVEDQSDLIAERARTLGGTAQGTIQVASTHSFLVPYPLGVADTKEHLFAVAGALAAFEQSVREAIDATAAGGDAETSDIFTEVGRAIAKQLWFVEAHLGAG